MANPDAFCVNMQSRYKPEWLETPEELAKAYKSLQEAVDTVNIDLTTLQVLGCITVVNVINGRLVITSVELKQPT